MSPLGKATNVFLGKFGFPELLPLKGENIFCIIELILHGAQWHDDKHGELYTEVIAPCVSLQGHLLRCNDEVTATALSTEGTPGL